MHSLHLRALGILLLAPALTLPMLLACTCDPGGPPPPPNACSGAPATTTATELAFGNASGTFVPVPSGGALDLVRGGQGAEMAAIRVGIRTTETFSCLPVRIDGSWSFERAIPVRRDGEWLVTDTLYQTYPSSSMAMTLDSLGLNLSGTWFFDNPDYRDAAIVRDAYTPDAPDYFDAPRRPDAASTADAP